MRYIYIIAVLYKMSRGKSIKNTYNAILEKLILNLPIKKPAPIKGWADFITNKYF